MPLLLTGGAKPHFFKQLIQSLLLIFSLWNLISYHCNHTDSRGWLNRFDLSRVDTFEELESYLFIFRAFHQRVLLCKRERKTTTKKDRKQLQPLLMLKKASTEASVAAVLPELGSIFTLRENVIQRSTAGHVFTLLLISDFGMTLVKLQYFTFFFLTLIICFYS